jgi:hypothetical protein
MSNENKVVWEQPTKEEIEKMKAEQQVMEFFANIGGRTLGERK